MIIPDEIKQKAHSLLNQGLLAEAKQVLQDAYRINREDADIY